MLGEIKILQDTVLAQCGIYWSNKVSIHFVKLNLLTIQGFPGPFH